MRIKYGRWTIKQVLKSLIRGRLFIFSMIYEEFYVKFNKLIGKEKPLFTGQKINYLFIEEVTKI